MTIRYVVSEKYSKPETRDQADYEIIHCFHSASARARRQAPEVPGPPNDNKTTEEMERQARGN